jgi:hypothetical protein
MEDLSDLSVYEDKEMQNKALHTSLTLRESPPGYVLTRLTRTLEPLNVPSYTHPRSDSESVHDFGSTSLMPHMFLSSCKDSWNTGPV